MQKAKNVNLRDVRPGGGGGDPTALVNSVALGGYLRNNWDGWVGFQFTVGSANLTVTELGRWVVSGNSGNHVVKLFYSDGNAVPNGEVTVSAAGQRAGQFAYATLPMPVTLAANTIYAVMSREIYGGDNWYGLQRHRADLERRCQQCLVSLGLPFVSTLLRRPLRVQ